MPLTEGPQDQANPRQGPSGPPWEESPHLSPARQGLLVCGVPSATSLGTSASSGQKPLWTGPAPEGGGPAQMGEGLGGL